MKHWIFLIMIALTMSSCIISINNPDGWNTGYRYTGIVVSKHTSYVSTYNRYDLRYYLDVERSNTRIIDYVEVNRYDYERYNIGDFIKYN